MTELSTVTLKLFREPQQRLKGNSSFDFKIKVMKTPNRNKFINCKIIQTFADKIRQEFQHLRLDSLEALVIK